MAIYFTGLLLLLGRGYLCWSLKPQLNVTDEFLVDIRHVNSFSIRCEGSERLHWNWSPQVRFSSKDDNINITDTKNENSERPFISTLTIVSPGLRNTDFYRCQYHGAKNPTEMIHKGESTYVYIYDGESGLVQSDGYSIEIDIGEKLRLDCRTTLPNITVILEKDGVEVPRDEERIQFYHKMGYRISNVTLQDKGVYTCKTTDPVSSIVFNVSFANESLSKELSTGFINFPIIDWEPNQRFVVGRGFSINCSVSISGIVREVTYHWDIPNPSSEYIIEAPRKVPETFRSRSFKYRIVSTLHVLNATLQDSGSYICHASKGWEDKKSTRRNITVQANESLSKDLRNDWDFDTANFIIYPIIDWEPNQHFVVGRGFSINCSVSIIGIVREVIYHWDIPNPSSEYIIEAPRKVPETFRPIGSKYRIMSTLHVLNATLQDSGTYICNASKGWDKESTSQNITVQENLSPYIYIFSNSLVSEYEGPGNDLTWRVGLRVFPPNPEIKYKDWKGKEVVNTSRVSIENNIRGSKLTIKDVTAEDFGNHTIEVTLKDEEVIDSHTIRFQIYSKPLITLRITRASDSELVNASCQVVGYPLANISWTYHKTCPNEELNCPSNSSPILAEYEDSKVLPPGNIINSSISFYPEASGTIRCHAKNKEGESSEISSVSSRDPGISTEIIIGLTIFFSSIGVFVIVVIYLVKRVKKEMEFRKAFRENELHLFEKGNVEQLNPDCTADEQAELLPYDQVWEIDRNRIEIGKQLGTGAFGRVMKAVVSNLEDGKATSTVAVKMCKSQADYSQTKALTMELKIMIHLGKHLNIVNLMGASTTHISKGELWILVEYCQFGNLQSFMHRHRDKFIDQIDPVTGKIDFAKTGDDTALFSSSFNYVSRYHAALITDKDIFLSPNAAQSTPGYLPIQKSFPHPLQSSSSVTGSLSDSGNLSDVEVDLKNDAGIVPAISSPFTTSDLVCWAWQVAQGMDYLSYRKVLHGDLATRNLLLSYNNVIKISDFGLSRKMYKKDVYTKKGDDLMPMKWMAIEAIRDHIFSVQSDVWAYGVTLWEIFTLGSIPYPGIEAYNGFLRLLEDGHRMDKPKYGNSEMYDILLSCWESDPRERPTFTMVAEQLGALMLPDHRGQYVAMNNPYREMNEERFKNNTDYLDMLASPDFDNLDKRDEAVQQYVNIREASEIYKDSSYIDTKTAHTIGTNDDLTSVAKPRYMPWDVLELSSHPIL